MSNGQATNGYASLEQLRAAAPMAERDLEPVSGVRVRIRALSRHAQHQINREAAVGLPGQDFEKAEYLMWVHCLVAPAVPTVEDAAALFAALDAGVPQAITDGITALSGLSEEAQAASAAAFRPRTLDGDLAFEYSLAERLGMTVGELRLRMSASEYLEWGRFLGWRAQEERWQRQRAQAAHRRAAPGAGGREMAVTAAELQVRVTADTSAALSGLNRVNKAVSGAGSFFAGAAQSALGFIGGAVGLNAVSSVVGGVSSAVFGLNSTLEGSAIALETMLGSSKAAGDQLQKLKQFATATPFELPQLLEAQQKLLAFGFSVNDVIPLLTNLGDAASGLNLDAGGMNRLIIAIGQIQAKGRVQGDELLQLTEAGIPAMKLLAQHMGKTTAQTQKLVSAGKVPADVFLAAFQGFAKANFGGLMAKQARTLVGAASNIKDSIGFGLAEAFFPLFDLIRSLAVDLADFLQTTAFTDFVARVKSGIASLVQPFGTFLVMTGRLAQAHGLNLFHAALVALNIILGQVFGPATAQSFNDVLTTIQTLGAWAAAKLPQAFAWFASKLPGWIEAGAVKLQQFAAWLETGAPPAVDAVIAKFTEWKNWIMVEIPKMVVAVATAIGLIQVAVFQMIDATMRKIEDIIIQMSNLGVFGLALKPAADAIRAQRAALPGGPPSGGGGSGFGGGGVGAVNINFTGPINATDPTQVASVAAAIAAAITDAASASEPSPPATLAGVLP